MRPPFVTLREEDKESISTLLQRALVLGKCNHAVFHSTVGNMCRSYPKAMVGAAVPNPLGNLVKTRKRKITVSIF